MGEHSRDRLRPFTISLTEARFRLPNSGLELHDSVLHSISQTGSTMSLVLDPGMVHWSQARPGWVPGILVMQRVVFEFKEATLIGEAGELPADIFKGDLSLSSETLLDLVDLPFQSSGAASLVLYLSPDAREVRISGRDLSVRSVGEPRYLERFPGFDEEDES